MEKFRYYVVYLRPSKDRPTSMKITISDSIESENGIDLACAEIERISNRENVYADGITILNWKRIQ